MVLLCTYTFYIHTFTQVTGTFKTMWYFDISALDKTNITKFACLHLNVDYKHNFFNEREYRYKMILCCKNTAKSPISD